MAANSPRASPKAQYLECAKEQLGADEQPEVARVFCCRLIEGQYVLGNFYLLTSIGQGSVFNHIRCGLMDFRTPDTLFLIV